MTFGIRSHPAVKKDLRRIDPRAREQVTSSILPKLSNDPFQGVPLVGPLRGIWKYRVFILGVWYRIAYLVDTQQKEIIILAIGSRGGFYERLKRRSKR